MTNAHSMSLQTFFMTNSSPLRKKTPLEEVEYKEDN